MRRRQHGMTLIELIIAIVVIGVCVVSALSLVSSLSLRSAQAMTQAQAAAIAASYLEGILSRPFAIVNAAADIDDAGARDINGNAIVGLGQHRVQVRFFPAALGIAPDAVAARGVEVTVTSPTGATTRATGYRTSYTNQVLY